MWAADRRRRRSVLTPTTVADLEGLLELEPALAQTPYRWLGQRVTDPSPAQINETVEKLDFLKWLGTDQWDLTWLGPKRVSRLADAAQRSGSTGLAAMPARRRHRHLLAWCSETLVVLVDELVDLFDQALLAAEGLAEAQLEQARRGTAESASRKVELFSLMAQVLLDPAVPDRKVRAAVFAEVPRAELAAAETEADEVVRSLEANHVELLAHSYRHLRSFVPGVLATLELHGGPEVAELLEALALLRRLDAAVVAAQRSGRPPARERPLPTGAPTAFVPLAWRPYVVAPTGALSRRHWELCLLSQLRTTLSAGQVWVSSSRRFSDPMAPRVRRGPPVPQPRSFVRPE